MAINSTAKMLDRMGSSAKIKHSEIANRVDDKDAEVSATPRLSGSQLKPTSELEQVLNSILGSMNTKKTTILD